MRLRFLRFVTIVFVVLLTIFLPIATYAAISVDIVDSSLVPVTNPSVTFSGVGFDWTSQQSTGVIGTSSEQIYINKNNPIPPAWTLEIAAASGPSSLWQGSTYNYDYNGTAAEGRLQIDPSSMTITPESGCTTTGLTSGSASYFEQGVLDSITILSADNTSDDRCYWLVTGISATQDLPAGQEGGNYTIDLVLTVS